jgi:hypothetical protein
VVVDPAHAIEQRPQLGARLLVGASVGGDGLGACSQYVKARPDRAHGRFCCGELRGSARERTIDCIDQRAGLGLRGAVRHPGCGDDRQTNQCPQHTNHHRQPSQAVSHCGYSSNVLLKTAACPRTHLRWPRCRRGLPYQRGCLVSVHHGPWRAADCALNQRLAASIASWSAWPTRSPARKMATGNFRWRLAFDRILPRLHAPGRHPYPVRLLGDI